MYVSMVSSPADRRRCAGLRCAWLPRRQSVGFLGVLGEPGDHQRLADVAQDRAAVPGHNVEPVLLGEGGVLSGGIPAEPLEVRGGQHQIPLAMITFWLRAT